MDKGEWIFITNERAILIEATSMESATKYYMSKYSISKQPLHIVKITGRDAVTKQE
jgi:hypothetical protein